VVAAAIVARQTGRANLLSFDMGGTTAKASLIRNGQYETTPEYEVGGGASGNRWMHGTGHPIRVPVIDLAEVSAGGGSIAWVDRAGALRVGPHSAGADPGPACYARGGTRPTVTDCNLVLGYLDKGSLLAGDLPIDHAAAEAAVAKHLAEPLGVDVRTAAAAVIDVVNHAMAEALKIVLRPARARCAPVRAGGVRGAGPLHAAALAQELGIAEGSATHPRRVLGAGPGRQRSQARTTCARSTRPRIRRTGGAENRLRPPSRHRAAPCSIAPGWRPSGRRFERSVDARYERQSYELSVPSPRACSMRRPWPRSLETFHDRHRATYGHDNRAEPVQLVSARLTAVGAIPTLLVRDKTAPAGTDARKSARAYGSATPARWRPPSGTARACRPGSPCPGRP
jgi:N-methylhydantoinase A